MRFKTVIGVVIVLWAGGALAQEAEGRKAGVVKKLIEFGWDEPDPAFMRKHLAQLEASPFDGCVFHVDAKGPDGNTVGRLTWEGWGSKTFTDEELRHAVEDLKATAFKRFRHNFLRFNTTPAKLDWFDDHSAVIANARLAARVAREGGCPGILFDIEQYEGPLFNYRKQRDASSKSYEQYAAQVRQRGREVMAAFQDEYPRLTIFLTFGHSLPFVQSGGKREKLADASYGMLAPFLDGMLDAAKEGTKLVDGHELSYPYKDPAQYEPAYRKMKSEALAVVGADHQRYARHYSFGFGIWMDRDHRKLGWNEADPSKNYFTPQLLEAAVRKALQTSDEYVWVYTEIPRWWSEQGGPVKLPREYHEALMRARAGLAKE